MTMRFSDHPSDIVDRPYESWDLTLPTLSRRSRLYQLEPIGIGTPMVESLSGYLARLAEAHCLSPYLLDLKEVAPLVGRRHDVCYHRGEGGYEQHFRAIGQWCWPCGGEDGQCA
jgi:hypothetical protein